MFTGESCIVSAKLKGRTLGCGYTCLLSRRSSPTAHSPCSQISKKQNVSFPLTHQLSMGSLNDQEVACCSASSRLSSNIVSGGQCRLTHLINLRRWACSRPVCAHKWPGSPFILSFNLTDGNCIKTGSLRHVTFVEP